MLVSATGDQREAVGVRRKSHAEGILCCSKNEQAREIITPDGQAHDGFVARLSKGRASAAAAE